MLYLVLITFGIFVLFWLGDLYLTLKTVKYIDKQIEINPIIRGMLSGRGKLIYLVKPLELGIFLYLLWFLTNFQDVIPFYILLIFIFVYALLVVNNAHVYYLATKKESGAFKVVFMSMLIAMLLFIFLNYALYQDLGVAYSAIDEANNNYNNLYAQCLNNTTVSFPTPQTAELPPEVNLPIFGGETL